MPPPSFNSRARAIKHAGAMHKYALLTLCVSKTACTPRRGRLGPLDPLPLASKRAGFFSHSSFFFPLRLQPQGLNLRAFLVSVSVCRGDLQP